MATCCLLTASVSAFTPIAAQPRPGVKATSRTMFSGAGEGIPGEDNPEELKKMEEAARAMGMSLDEYKLGIRARIKLQKELDTARVSGGNKSTIAVERDANNPPKVLDITITEAGKALGPDKVSKELCAALKAASEDARKARTESQKGMMQFITDEMKATGKA
jgi:hypothetical protein